MTKEAQRIAIAKACGWQFDNSIDDGAGWYHQSLKGDLPDYLNDLNAMHEAEKTLIGEQMKIYRVELKKFWRVQAVFTDGVTATAAQRAEAFLRASGLWVEEMVEASAGK